MVAERIVTSTIVEDDFSSTSFPHSSKPPKMIAKIINGRTQFLFRSVTGIGPANCGCPSLALSAKLPPILPKRPELLIDEGDGQLEALRFSINELPKMRK